MFAAVLHPYLIKYLFVIVVEVVEFFVKIVVEKYFLVN
jgi:hypothetical protein